MNDRPLTFSKSTHPEIHSECSTKSVVQYVLAICSNTGHGKSKDVNTEAAKFNERVQPKARLRELLITYAHSLAIRSLRA